jgi:hypothetical protein
MQRQHERKPFANVDWWNVSLAVTLAMASIAIVCHFTYKTEDGEKMQPTTFIMLVVVFSHLIFVSLANYPIPSPPPPPPAQENITMMVTPLKGENGSDPAAPPPIIRRRVNPKINSDEQCQQSENQQPINETS